MPSRFKDLKSKNKKLEFFKFKKNNSQSEWPIDLILLINKRKLRRLDKIIEEL